MKTQLKATYNLHVGKGNVEVCGKIGVPDDTHIGEEEGAQIALLTG